MPKRNAHECGRRRQEAIFPASIQTAP